MFAGVYNVSATEQHTAPVYGMLEFAMRRSVQQRAARIETPAGLDDAALIRRGYFIFRDNCVQCHGAPGETPGDAGKGLLPVPNNLAQAAREWTAAEIYWVTRNGLKMTGMPAWGMRFGDDDLWAVVAFVRHMPALTVEGYRTLAAQAGAPPAAPPAPAATAGDVEAGRLALQQYACTTCHRIPGMVGSAVYVGPPLHGMTQRKLLAGRLPNSPENLVRWIREPQAVSPATLMPNLQVSEQHARDMAAYLYSRKETLQ